MTTTDARRRLNVFLLAPISQAAEREHRLSRAAATDFDLIAFGSSDVLRFKCLLHANIQRANQFAGCAPTRKNKSLFFSVLLFQASFCWLYFLKLCVRRCEYMRDAANTLVCRCMLLNVEF